VNGDEVERLLYDDEVIERIDRWTEREVGAGTSIARLAATRASGALLAGMMTRLGEILEGRPVGDEVAIVREQGDDGDGPGPLRLEFDPDSPSATRAVLRVEPD
jgi:hypothetical protein